MDVAPDWKERYRELLREHEVREREFGELARALRRTATRLCTAASGRHPDVDADIHRLNEAIKGEADAAALEQLGSALTERLLLVDLGALSHGPCDWPASRAALGAFLREMDVGAVQLPSPFDPLIAELMAAPDDVAVAAVIERATRIARDRGRIVERERVETGVLLAQVNERLDDMVGFLDAAQAARRDGVEDARLVNARVLSETRSIAETVQQAQQLDELRDSVSTGLEAIATEVREYGRREEARFNEQSQQSVLVAARMKQLEQRTRELTASLDEERRRARVDALTGIPNRAAFDEKLTEELQRARRLRTPLSLLIWDVDRFKSINDSYGHRAGDRVLREIAKCLQSRLRATDFVARIGGEEFGTLLIGTSLDGATKVANDLRQAVADLKLQFRGTPVPVTASCGVTEIRATDDAVSPHELFERADAALYRAKHAGRNLCVAA